VRDLASRSLELDVVKSPPAEIGRAARISLMKTLLIAAGILLTAMMLFRQVYVEWNRRPYRQEPDDDKP
jgi:hypothetical protein